MGGASLSEVGKSLGLSAPYSLKDISEAVEGIINGDSGLYYVKDQYLSGVQQFEYKIPLGSRNIENKKVFVLANLTVKSGSLVNPTNPHTSWTKDLTGDFKYALYTTSSKPYYETSIRRSGKDLYVTIGSSWSSANGTRHVELFILFY